jgi:hypothetical protein
LKPQVLSPQAIQPDACGQPQTPPVHCVLAVAAPHAVPSVTGISVSVHVDVPVEHEEVPTSHGLAGTQLAPAVHETHAPPLQTSLGPHTNPFCCCV